MTEGELIRINSDLSIKLRKAVDGHDFTVRDLVQWILNDVDLEVCAKKLAHEVEFELETYKENRR